MRSFLRKLAEHAIPLGAVAFLMSGSAFAAGLVTGSQIQNGSITGKDVKDKSLSPKDFKGSVAGAAGKAGETGPPGAPGTPGGEIETELVQDSTESDMETPKEHTVKCPNGPLLGGGYVLQSGTDQTKLRAIRSYAVTKTEWLVRAVSEVAQNWELTVVATCVK